MTVTPTAFHDSESVISAWGKAVLKDLQQDPLGKFFFGQVPPTAIFILPPSLLSHNRSHGLARHFLSCITKNLQFPLGRLLVYFSPKALTANFSAKASAETAINGAWTLLDCRRQTGCLQKTHKCKEEPEKRHCSTLNWDFSCNFKRLFPLIPADQTYWDSFSGSCFW